MQPTLSNDMVELRPLTNDDFEALFTVASDPQIWEHHPYKCRAERDGFTKYFTELIDSKGAFCIIDKNNNNVIGACRYYECNYADSEIELGGAFLSREYWGGVWFRTCLGLMLEHAFKFVDQAVFLVHPDNHRSLGAVGKTGATPSEDRKNQDGVMHRCFIMTKDSFAALLKSKPE
jgi:RimJ/RimL family protein N-acetyltransferase